MFFYFIFSILWLYFIIFSFLFLLYFWISNILISFWLVFSLLLLVCVILDERFIISRKIIFICLNILQLIIYIYLDIIPILLVKDIFWFSLLLNIGFIWHVILLHWCFRLCYIYKWNYGCYIVSRLSILTSLTGLLLIIKGVHLYFTLILVYFEEINFNKKSYKLIRWFFIKINFFEYFECLIFILYLIINFFISRFNYYSKFFLGLNEKWNWNRIFTKLFWIYLGFFLVTFFISYYYFLPRLYIFWFGLIFWKFLNFIYLSYYQLKLPSSKYLNQFSKCYAYFYLIKSMLRRDIFSYNMTNDWSLIYLGEFFLDYYLFFSEEVFFHEGYRNQFHYLDYFDIMKFFIYNENWRYFIILKFYYFKIFLEVYEGREDLVDNIINFYFLDKEKFINLLFLSKRNFEVIFSSSFDISLYDYLMMDAKRYVIDIDDSICITFNSK